MIRVLDARFLKTAVEPDGYPQPDRPEIAFVGRSNVGKSSMINALAGRNKLVRVSNTPGRTRTLNFFDVDLDVDGSRVLPRLVDLPGYGFAKAPKTEKKEWERMISRYLESRSVLKVVVAIVDAEVGPTPEDLSTLGYLVDSVPRVLLVATKIDRLPKAKRKPRIQELARITRLPEAAVVPFSATLKLGVDEVWESLTPQLSMNPGG